MLLQDKIFEVKQPSFTRVEFMDYNQLRFVTYFDSLGNRKYADHYNYLSGVDSCAAYIIFDIKTSYHPITVLEKHPHKLLATYKRVNDTSWLCYENERKYLLLENRKKFVATDTVHIEDPLNPGTFLLFVTDYYDVTIK